jgi:hypothetical protein
LFCRWLKKKTKDSRNTPQKKKEKKNKKKVLIIRNIPMTSDRGTTNTPIQQTQTTGNASPVASLLPSTATLQANLPSMAVLRDPELLRDTSMPVFFSSLLCLTNAIKPFQPVIIPHINRELRSPGRLGLIGFGMAFGFSGFVISGAKDLENGTSMATGKFFFQSIDAIYEHFP